MTMEMGVPAWYLERSVRSVTRFGLGELGPVYTVCSGCMLCAAGRAACTRATALAATPLAPGCCCCCCCCVQAIAADTVKAELLLLALVLHVEGNRSAERRWESDQEWDQQRLQRAVGMHAAQCAPTDLTTSPCSP